LVALVGFSVKASLLIEGEDAECHSNDADWLSTNELDNCFDAPRSFTCELRQRMRLRVIPHLIESADIQPINVICLVDDQQSKGKSHDSARPFFPIANGFDALCAEGPLIPSRHVAKSPN
jgi:hypothetical protein